MAARPKNVLLLWTDQQRADTVGPDKDSRLRMPNLGTIRYYPDDNSLVFAGSGASAQATQAWANKKPVASLGDCLTIHVR